MCTNRNRILESMFGVIQPCCCSECQADREKVISGNFVATGKIIPSSPSPTSLKEFKDLKDKIASFIEDDQDDGFSEYREACQELLKITKDW